MVVVVVVEGIGMVQGRQVVVDGHPGGVFLGFLPQRRDATGAEVVLDGTLNRLG